jgi:alginate O-acetyltransferase complex protein AlgI
MLFHEPLFLIFFPVLYVLYLSAKKGSAKSWILLCASILFYTWGEPLFVPVLFVSILIDYQLSRSIVTAPERSRRALLAFGIAGNLGVLIFYKYTDFLAANLNLALAPFTAERLPLLNIALPIGVSFVVFEKITYLVDIYRGVSKPAGKLAHYAMFVFLFPKLLAGPILKYHDMAEQIATPRHPEWEDFWQGLLRFIRGLAKKLLIADTVAPLSDMIFGAPPGTLSAHYAWLGAACFAIQIYFDFSGYSDMAIGLARMFGYRFSENFRNPFISQTLTEFWQRWHISFTTFIRDYLYVALGRNRKGHARYIVNLWICFLLSGLWHGASWNFVIWGAYNGMILMLDRMFLSKFVRRSGRIVGMAITLVILMFSFAIFRSTSIDHLTGHLAAMIGLSSGAATFDIPGDIAAAFVVGWIICLLPAMPFYEPLRRAYLTRALPYGFVNAMLIVLYVLAFARSLAVPFKPFIYFRF